MIYTAAIALGAVLGAFLAILCILYFRLWLVLGIPLGLAAAFVLVVYLGIGG